MSPGQPHAPFRAFFAPLFRGAPALLLASLLAGCLSNEKASYQTPARPTGPAAASATVPQPGGYQYPTPPGVGSGGPGGDYQAPGFGSVEAYQPSLVSFRRNDAPDAAAPRVTAKAAILVNSQGRVLFEKNADARLPAASTQKLLVGLLVAERGNLSAPVTVAEADTWAEPTIMGIKPGEVYTREQLLKAVLVRSCNDIARCLGRDHSGSEAAFVANMNARARQLGMTSSYFTNSNGLPSPPGQYSTARDLARLGLAALRNPTVREICQMRSYNFRLANGSVRTLTNTNQVLRYFPYCTGLKTGTTNAAGKCLVSSATANGRTVVAVILGSSSPAVWQESEALLKYGLGM